MAMTMARLEAPWQLATYTSTSQEGLPFPCAATPVVHIGSTKGKQKASDREFACLTVQGASIYILEISEQAAVESFALGPSARFTAPAVSYSTPSGSSPDINGDNVVHRTRRTFAALQGIDGGGEIRCWMSKERKDGSTEGEATVTSCRTPQIVTALSVGITVPGIFASLSDGRVLCLDQDLRIVAASNPNETKGTASTSRLQVFEASDCPFARSFASTRATTLLCLTRLVAHGHSEERRRTRKSKGNSQEDKVEHRAYIDVWGVAIDIDAPRIFHLQMLEMPETDLLDLSLDITGCVAAICALSILYAYSRDSSRTAASSRLITKQLSAGTEDALSVVEGATVQLKSTVTSLAPIRHQTLQLDANLTLMTSSHRDRASTLVLTLWDMSYRVVLADQELPLPNALDACSSISISLQRIGATSVSIVLSAANAPSFVFVQAIPLPYASTLAAAIESRTRTLQHVVTSESTASSDAVILRNPLMSEQRWAHLQEGEKSRMQALKRILAAITTSKDAVQAQVAYETWYAEEKQRLVAFAEEMQQSRNKKLSSKSNGSDASKIHGTMESNGINGLHKRKRKAKGRRLRDPEPTLTLAFVASIANSLLDAQHPSSNFGAPLLHILLERGVLVNHAVHKGIIPRLLERQDWIGLRLALQRVPDLPEADLIHLLSAACTQAPDDRPLSFWLARVADYRVSLTLLRSALRAILTPVQSNQIFGILITWLTHDLRADRLADSHCPSLQSTTRFAQAMLDAHFVSLLSDTALHEHMEMLHRVLQPLLDISRDLQTLRGPLTPFVRAAKDKKRMSYQDERTRGSGPQRRKEARKNALAESVAAGPYSVEGFDL